MSDLVTWLRAQLDEDERVARAASVGPWDTSGPDTIAEWGIYSKARGWKIAEASVNSYPESEWPKLRGGIDGDEANANAEHIARHDPARVLREVAAKRAIVDAYLPPGENPHPGEPCTNTIAGDPAGEFYSEYDGCERHIVASRRRFHGDHLLRLLAAVYSDRDGYREEWAPDPSG